jgi:hypothetical protein
MFAVTKGAPRELLRQARPHIAAGEARGFHERYKCRIREPWWELPLPDGPPDLLLTYCSNEHPRLVLNSAKVLNTNTIHGVRLFDRRNAKALAAGFYNSLTLLSAELVGRSYGGGVLKLEPSEAEALMVPPLPAGAAKLLPDLDRAVRERNIEAALDIVDPVVLRPLGLSSEDIAKLRSGRERLRERRRRRGRAPR